MAHIGSLIQMLAKGGPVMIPLVVCSVVALAVVIERLGFWWRQGDLRAAERALELAERGKLDEALEVARGARTATARVVAAGLAERQAPPTAAMEAAAQAEMRRLRSYLPVLDTIITLSPLLGLLGTVTGMIAAFGILSTTGMNQPTAITGGVAEALIATAAGLAVAIATLVPYNYFLSRAEQAMDAMERLASRLDLALREQQIP
ncbi:MAG: MotA/TolQ/ExbB proton channel family protein [Candidatus Rokuibacteriota bacterium]